MKKYDYKHIKHWVQMHSDLIDCVSLGMMEDWSRTADTIYEDEKFTVNLDECPLIAGISGSSWATPAMLVIYKDGQEKITPCFIGESDRERPEWFSLGVISGPAQDYIDSLREPKLLT